MWLTWRKVTVLGVRGQEFWVDEGVPGCGERGLRVQGREEEVFCLQEEDTKAGAHGWEDSHCQACRVGRRGEASSACVKMWVHECESV